MPSHSTLLPTRLGDILIRLALIAMLLPLAALTPKPALAASAVRSLSGATLPRNDDDSSSAINLGFTINYFGSNYSQAYVNNNGNLTFDSAYRGFSPSGMSASTQRMIAGLWYDVDTRPANGGTVTYGTATVGGRSAFFATWDAVGYCCNNTDKLNTFQLVVIDRSDVSAGSFDIEYNYNSIFKDPASAGYSDGSGGTNDYGFAGSVAAGGLLDSNATTGLANYSTNSATLGRHIVPVRDGAPFVAQLLSPTNNATSVSIAPTLSWQALSGATYRLIVSTSADLSSPLVDQSGLTSTSYDLSGLNMSTPYYWAVEATDGTYTTFSSVRRFTTIYPSVSVGVAPASVVEDGSNNLVYTFSRTGPTTGTLTVNFNVSGNATLNTDYTQSGAATFNSTGTVVIPDGQASATITLDPTADNIDESDEAVTLALTSGSSYAIGSSSVVSGTITDDEDTPVFTSAMPISGTAGTSYSHTFVASGSPVPSFSVVTGDLPPGLTLNGQTGALSGTPTQVGTFSFTIMASNSAGSDNQNLTLTINKAPQMLIFLPTITNKCECIDSNP